MSLTESVPCAPAYRPVPPTTGRTPVAPALRERPLMWMVPPGSVATTSTCSDFVPRWVGSAGVDSDGRSLGPPELRHGVREDAGRPDRVSDAEALRACIDQQRHPGCRRDEPDHRWAGREQQPPRPHTGQLCRPNKRTRQGRQRSGDAPAQYPTTRAAGLRAPARVEHPARDCWALHAADLSRAPWAAMMTAVNPRRQGCP